MTPTLCFARLDWEVTSSCGIVIWNAKRKRVHHPAREAHPAQKERLRRLFDALAYASRSRSQFRNSKRCLALNLPF